MRRVSGVSSVVVAGLLLAGVTACSDDGVNPVEARGAVTPSSATAVTTTAAPTTTAAGPVLATAAPVVGPPVEGSGLRLLTTATELVAEQDLTTGLSYLSPMVRLATLASDLEVTVTRADYESEITTVARFGTTGRPVELPAGSADDWNGLAGFVDVSVVDTTGTTVFAEPQPVCLNGYKERVAPGGPVIDPYPGGCYGNPFSLGAVWGVAEGWASPVDLFVEVDIPAGQYELVVSIAEPYRDLLGADSTIRLPLTITPGAPQEPAGDVDRDGIPDDGDPIIDVDADGIDDVEDPFVDGDADGLDDYSGFTEAEAAEAFSGDGSPSGSGEAPIDGTETEPLAHQGRPAGGVVPDAAMLPDLVPLPAYGISTDFDSADGIDLLTFSADTWNRGPAPLVVDGYLRTGEPGVMDAFQQFFRAGRATDSAPIGTLEFHAGGGHDHWHFHDFSRYELVPADGGPSVRSGKESWCLASTDAIDLTLPGADWQPETSDMSTACGDETSLWVRETLPVGWGDTYTQFVAGQAFDITGLPNGAYLVRITANPEGNLYEADETNNVAERRVVLGGVPGSRTVEVPQVGLIDSETDFEPIGFGSAFSPLD